MLKALKPDQLRGGSLTLVVARVRELVCPAMGCSARFAEQKEVNRHVRNNHPMHGGTNTQGGRGAGPGSNAPLGNPVAEGGNGSRPPGLGVISTRPVRTANSAAGGPLPRGNARGHSRDSGELPCPVAGCSKVYKSAGWLARHVKSDHSGLAVPENSITPPTVSVVVVEPAPLLTRSLPVPRRHRGGAGEAGVLLMVGAGSAVNPLPETGQGPVGNPVQLIGDDECGSHGYCLRRRPREQQGGRH